MIDVTALGELLIDFTPAGLSSQGAALYARNAGGAPANVLAMLSILGQNTQMIAKIGKDAFGQFLKTTLLESGVGCEGLLEGSEPTTLAFVQLDPSGDRSFEFHRNHSADITLHSQEIPERLLTECRIFHFGSVSMTDEPVRTATLVAAKIAKEAGACISYDPNYRPLLWKNSDEAVAVMKQGLTYADIVKMSDEEAYLLTGQSDPYVAAEKILELGAKLVLITAGAQGAWYATKDFSGYVPAFSVKVVDTTGAGDTFLGALLYKLLSRQDGTLEGLGRDYIQNAVRFASAAGALCATGFGAIASMPTESQIYRMLEDTVE